MTDGVNPEGNSELSVTQGGDEIAALLNPQEPETPEREAVEPEQANGADATDHVSDDETDQDEPETDDADEADTEAGDNPEESEDDEAEDSPEEEPRTVTLKDGTQVSLDEVVSGYMKDADYRRKTQELAASRKELETRQAEIAQKAQSFEQQASFAIELLKANLPQEPDISMLRDDPVGYWEQKALYDNRVQQLQQLQAAKQQAEQERQAQSQQQRAQYLTQQRDALLTAMPELKDPKKANEFTTDLVKTIESYGFTKEDLGTVEDHRLFLLAKDAMAYRKLMASKPKAQAKAKDAPPVQKPGRRASQTGQKARAQKDKMDRLRQTGSLHDGADVILDLIKG